MIDTEFAEDVSMMEIRIDGYETMMELRSFTIMGNKRIQELIQVIWFCIWSVSDRYQPLHSLFLIASVLRRDLRMNITSSTMTIAKP